MIQLCINRKDILLQLFIADILQFQRLDCIGKETACRFKYRIRITHQVDKLGVREHFHQFFHPARMRRVLAEELRTLGIPQRNLDQFCEYLFKHFQFFVRDIIKQQILVRIFLLIFRQEPEIIIGIRHHVRQCKLFLLRKIHCQLHIIRRTLVRHQPAHILLEERLSPHHQMREYGLISCVIPKMLVAGEHVMYKSSSTPPVSQNEYRIMFQRLIGQQLFVAFILQCSQRRKQAAHRFRQPVLAFISSINITAGSDCLKRFPVGTYQRINRKFIKFK